MPDSHSFEISKLETFVFRVPSDPPVRTSFGIMRDRPAVLVRVTSKDGFQGWGEVWCNFPTVGAEHRARLVESYVAPLLAGQTWESPRHCFDTLTESLHILSVQTGEPGPLAQALAGVDIAIWDMVARRADLPLWRYLNGKPKISVYASGINPDHPERVAEQKAREGHTAFKLKVGFGDDRDEANLRALRSAMGSTATLMVDANQAWTQSRAIDMVGRLIAHGLAWLEEPLPADTPWHVWNVVSRCSRLAIAAGENLRGLDTFEAAMDSGDIEVIQPDIGKWGGFSGCLPVGQEVLERERMFCPHWLGGGVGLTASMHLKAAVGGPGYVEVDANANVLRDWLLPQDYAVRNGNVTLSDAPGLGVEPPLERLSPFLVSSSVADLARLQPARAR